MGLVMLLVRLLKGLLRVEGRGVSVYLGLNWGCGSEVLGSLGHEILLKLGGLLHLLGVL